MFTGIISHQGRFRGYRKGRSEMSVEAPGLAGNLAPGDSVAVNGVCLTLAGTDRGALRFDLSRETRARSTLGTFRPDELLNLELPLTLAAPLSGHLVSGHVDGAGTVLRASARPPGRNVLGEAEHGDLLTAAFRGQAGAGRIYDAHALGGHAPGKRGADRA